MRLGTTAMAEKGPMAKNRTKVKHIKQISLMDVTPCSLDVVPETGFELMFDNLPIYFLVRVRVLMAFLLSYKGCLAKLPFRPITALLFGENSNLSRPLKILTCCNKIIKTRL
jgi:hypothetical protein